MSVSCVCVVCCKVEVSDGPISRLEEYYGMCGCVCVWVWVCVCVCVCVCVWH